MSKKNKIKKHKSHQPHANAQLKRIGTVKKEVRKGPSILTLAIMGGAVILVYVVVAKNLQPLR